MKKALIVALVAGLLAGALVGPAEAKKKKKKKPARVTREAEGTYDAPTLIVVGSCTQTGAIGCVTFATGEDENFVTAKVTDSHGQPVYVSVQADENGDAQDDTVFGSFCGETTEPISITAGMELHFWVGLSPDPGFVGCAPGFATSGSVAVTFSNLP